MTTKVACSRMYLFNLAVASSHRNTISQLYRPKQIVRKKFAIKSSASKSFSLKFKNKEKLRHISNRKYSCQREIFTCHNANEIFKTESLEDTSYIHNRRYSFHNITLSRNSVQRKTRSMSSKKNLNSCNCAIPNSMTYNCWKDPNEFKPIDKTLEDTPQMKIAMSCLKNIAKSLDRYGIYKSSIRKQSYDSPNKTNLRQMKKISVEGKKRMKAMVAFTQKLCEIADLMEGKIVQKSRSANNSFKKKSKKKKKSKRKTLKPLNEIEKLEMIDIDKKRDSAAKESSLEKHLDESVQDDTLMKRNIIERRSSKNIGNLNTRFDTNSFHSLKKEGELKLNLNLCPILIDQEVENLTYSKTARNEYNHKYSTGSHENQENKTTASAEFVKKKKKRSQKNRMMTAREYIVKQGRNYDNLLLYNIDDLDNMIKSLSQIGSQETSNSESTNSPKTQNKI